MPITTPNTIRCRLQQWWLHRSPSTARGGVCGLLPSLICWGLWKDRNEAMYEAVNVTPSQVCRNVQNLLFNISQAWPFVQVTHDDGELLQSGLLLSVTRRKWRPPRWITWAMPPSGNVKLNIDGSSLGNPGPSGARGVLRDSDGNVLSSFSLFLGSRTNMEAEALALLDGMQITAGFHELQVEMDSQALLNMVIGNGSVPWKLWSTVAHVKA